MVPFPLIESRASHVLCKTLVASLAALISLALITSAARADYVLASGDVVHISVYNVPEMQTDVAVDIDGRVAFEPLGPVDAKGLSLTELADRVRRSLADREILNDAQVTVGLVAARPVYIGGDVTAPGAYPYRAGLTVRQAVALAGGLGLARIRGFEDVAELHGTRQSLAVDLLRAQARLARADAALTGATTLTLSQVAAKDTIPAVYRDEILQLETEALQSDLHEAAEQKAYLDRTVALVRSRIATLGDQRILLSEQLARQEAEMERIREIREQGLTAQTRVVEEQRAYDSLQARAADNATEAAAVRGQLEAALHEFQRFDDRRAAALAGDKQAALLEIGRLQGTLWGVEERLAQLGAAGATAQQVTIYRNGTGGPGEPADPATVLGPGDTIEVVALPTLPVPSTAHSQAEAAPAAITTP